MMGKSNDQAKISVLHLKTTQYYQNNRAPDRRNFRPTGQTLRKTLFKTSHQTKVQRDSLWHCPTSGKKTVVSSGPKIAFAHLRVDST